MCGGRFVILPSHNPQSPMQSMDGRLQKENSRYLLSLALSKVDKCRRGVVGSSWSRTRMRTKLVAILSIAALAGTLVSSVGKLSFVQQSQIRHCPLHHHRVCSLLRPESKWWSSAIVEFERASRRSIKSWTSSNPKTVISTARLSGGWWGRGSICTECFFPTRRLFARFEFTASGRKSSVYVALPGLMN